MTSLLEKVNSPEDIKSLSYEQLDQLSSEIRDFLITSLSKTGGHLASNLGSVELTLAINRVYNVEKDRVLFDVGHQSYTHKILTGRKSAFPSLRSLNGLAGFPRPYESPADPFIAGHSSDSVSVGLGMAKARTLLKEDYDVCVVLGDGSLTGGLAYEGLENAAQSGEPMVIILNDNAMSISKNVGGISKSLQKMRVSPDYINFKKRYRNIVGIDTELYRTSHKLKEFAKSRLLQGNIFSEMGLYYLGPVDGHNIKDVEAALTWAKEMEKPVLLHVVTQKGRGCSYASLQPNKYHGVGPFDPVSGDIKGSSEDFSSHFGQYLTALASEDEKIVALTAAMTDGTGLDPFLKRYPERLLDVGITEGNAVAVAAGMAKQGLKPVFAVYSSFLQRAYDMLIHDVSLQKLHVVLCVDRAGIVGKDGETHQGTFDLAFLSTVPGMEIFCPASYEELGEMLKIALYSCSGPVAVRYPRGQEGEYRQCRLENSAIKTGKDITIVSHGVMINEALDAEAQLVKEGISCDVIKISRVFPLDASLVIESVKKTGRLIVCEDVAEEGSLGQRLLLECQKAGLFPKVTLLNCGSGIVTHGAPKDLRRLLGIDKAGIINAANEMLWPK